MQPSARHSTSSATSDFRSRIIKTDQSLLMSFSCRLSLVRRSLSCVSRAQTLRYYRRFCKAAERSTLIEEFEGNTAAEETVRLLLEGNRVKLAETITLSIKIS